MTEENSSRSRVLPLQKIALVLLGLTLSLVLLEGGLRLGGSILLTVQEHRNSQAIRQKGAYRILCLGESTTQGQYPRFLEEALNRRNIGVRFSVIDKGVAGTTTPVILNSVGAVLAQYHPDMVVAMMGINDRGKHMPFEVPSASKGVLWVRSFRIYKLARFLGLHLWAKAEAWGLCKTVKVRESSNVAGTFLPGGEGKGAFDGSIVRESSLKKTLEADPRNGQAWIGLGRLYLEQGKLVQAEDAFKKVIELDPGNDQAYIELGWLYQDQDALSQAEAFFKKAVEIAPGNDNDHVELGRFYRALRKFSKSRSSFDKAIEINPRSDYAYMELGRLYQSYGVSPEAEEAFKRALAINPGNLQVRLDLGWLYQDQGKLAQAEDVLKKAVQISPENDRLFKALSLLYKEMGKPELAETYAKKAERFRERDYSISGYSYRKLKQILDTHKVRLVCVQYPMRSVNPLKKALEGVEGVIFVDNERVFGEALKRDGYKEYFTDMFAGDFGHCTLRGNELLAQNIAETILREVFHGRNTAWA